MDNREQLLNEIKTFSDNLEEKNRLSAEISRWNSQNAKLQEELANAPTEQTIYVEEAEEEVLDAAWEQDKKLNSKIDRVFIGLTVLLAVVNMAVVYFMADKEAVAGRTQMINMELLGNVTAEELVNMFPFMLVLAVIFQIAAIIGAILILGYTLFSELSFKKET